MARKVLCAVQLLFAPQLGLGSLACCLEALQLTLSGLSGRYFVNMSFIGGLTDTRDVICSKDHANLLFSTG
jgi:hypothetical protein